MKNVSRKSLRKKFIRKYKKRGFTLIELIIVISIIAIVSAIAVPKYNGIQKDAKIKSDVASAKVIADATYALIAKEGITKATYISAKPLGDEIKAYIQVTPTVKAVTGGTFLVEIDPTDNVFVTVAGEELYPTQSEDYPSVTAPVTTP
ncbi:prepilin-type N-terminal cleavage/methylation domain-containing protein [Clostridium lacusfryxellense]|uniref:prepilin-type N-terminal cleavage/methylation domain-containing protein n=1 Tax=Clostridium lacusfryxellense TaxID=205328 RepID=UPI001C0C32D3|nr:prepilin-type N-terminal cleavage/methylation domain-containing protein [Clostridium lacusfryxellense]MBU3110321.1 prepilin-type N-terminal cleavage/methylation domain-containing protein [Clostridium lacusfryxellense]